MSLPITDSVHTTTQSYRQPEEPHVVADGRQDLDACGEDDEVDGIPEGQVKGEQ